MIRIHPILLRYLLIFLLFASFLLLLFVPIYGYVFDFTLKNELGYRVDRLRSGVAAIDASVIALNTTVISTERDSRFRIFKYNVLGPAANPYALSELRDAFNNMLLSHSLIADAGVLFSSEVVLTRQRVFYVPNQYVFYGQFLKCSELPWEEWKALLASGMPFVPVQSYTSLDFGRYDAITFTAYWARTNTPDEAVLYATLPVKTIIAMITDNDVASQGIIRIYDSRGNLLFEWNQNGGKTGGDMYFFTEQSTTNMLKFEIGVPSFLIDEKMRSVKNLLLFFTFVTAVFTVSLAVFFAWQSSKPLRKLLESIDTTKNIRSEYASLKTNLGIHVFKSLQRIYTDLAESISAVDTKLEYSLHVMEREAQLLRSQMLDKVYDALCGANDTAACKILLECTASLPNPEDPLIAGLVANMVSAMIARLKEENPLILSAVAAPEYIPGKQEILFGKQYPECFRQICECIKTDKEKGLTQFGRRILEYINGHLYDPELYIPMVSDHFNISPPTIRKLVRNMTGQTFRMYVETCRLSKAWEMLKSGGHSVQETAKACGFSNTNSFYRAFKRIYGFSPSEIQNNNHRTVK
jgi:AraC-like DNA-binding protein